jgi:hypothetical protein
MLIPCIIFQSNEEIFPSRQKSELMNFFFVLLELAAPLMNTVGQK